ncbi:unnamed protein product [Cylicocyclus nassatus]|uniref:DDE Tnp4 domain-containing protein n=1 Tax=Cylicocyclus nassatus TaxID=53992 RepID=A0AA36GNY9_CYLNA|nr:unnamed protein product [Cylicocyclus nassatus]
MSYKDPTTRPTKSLSYAVIGLNNARDSRNLFQFLRANGFTDVSISSDRPQAKQKFDVPFYAVDHCAPGPSFEAAAKNIIAEPLPYPDAVHMIEQTLDKVCACSCLLCGDHRHLVEAKAKKREQYTIFLACLLIQNHIDLEKAVKLYRGMLSARRRVCQEHYVKAAAFIGRKIKEVCGHFPIYGLNSVSTKIIEVATIPLHMFASCIDKGIVLGTHDVVRFFNDCLKKYFDVDGWNDEEMNRARANSRSYEIGYKRANRVSAVDKTLPKASSNKRQASPLFEPKEEKRPVSADLAVSSEPPPLFKDEKLDVFCLSADGRTTHPENPENERNKKPENERRTDHEYERVTNVVSERGANPVNERNANSADERDTKSSIDKCEPTSATAACIRAIEYGMADVDTLSDERFRHRFRMSRSSFNKVCAALDPHLKRRSPASTKSPTPVKVGTALEILAGNTKVLNGTFMGSVVTEIFNQVLDALSSWSGTVILWPTPVEKSNISEKFFEVTGLRGVVGCLDGTNVFKQSSKGKAINVAVVVDYHKKFRWVVANSKMDDETAFKRSLLCAQFRNGTKMGYLIGDDDYKPESFLLTPSGSCEEGDPLADALRSVHQIVEETIANWKSQFPILTSEIALSSKVARIILGTAALYNLTRAEGEIPFIANEGADLPQLVPH